MKLPFLLKYQPNTINDFINDADLKNFLNLLLKFNNLNILFNGKNGTGKSCMLTTIINEYYKDYTKSDIENNTLYINTLKDQGIQYYRNEVKTFCQTNSSIYGKKKFIIIDDIDNINEQSQQVFRNCIDSYSNNVNFIASCCNSQKILENIQSRLLILKMPDIGEEHLKITLNKIKETEDIVIDKDAEELTIKLCDNSLRLLINYLEKFKLIDCNIDMNIVKSICSNISVDKFDSLTKLMVNDKNLQSSLKEIYSIYDEGYSVMDILDNYFQYIKNSSKLNDETKYKIIKIICKYITIINDIHEHQIELALFVNNIIMID